VRLLHGAVLLLSPRVEESWVFIERMVHGSTALLLLCHRAAWHVDVRWWRVPMHGHAVPWVRRFVLHHVSRHRSKDPLLRDDW
jgi:hypothetical protein